MSLTRIVLNGISTGASVKFALYNDALREQVQRGAVAWQPYMGYLSDFFVPLAIVSGVATYASLINHLKRGRLDYFGRRQLENSLEKLVLGSSLVTATGFSILEQINEASGGVSNGFDWTDIACYFGGAGAGYLIYALTEVFEEHPLQKLVYGKKS